MSVPVKVQKSEAAEAARAGNSRWVAFSVVSIVMSPNNIWCTFFKMAALLSIGPLAALAPRWAPFFQRLFPLQTHSARLAYRFNAICECRMHVTTGSHRKSYVIVINSFPRRWVEQWNLVALHKHYRLLPYNKQSLEQIRVGINQ
jgi:hypothetical protein